MNTLMTESTERPPSARITALREGALVLTVLACLPYLVLKTAWIFGSHIGIPADSALLGHEGTMRAANGLTVLMDVTAVILAFALARPWGHRIPAWLIAGPLWVATGLLAPIVVAFPLQSLVGSSEASAAPDFLEPWVFTVVYGGFCLQALGLGTLLVLHAVRRWGYLWRGTVGQLPAPSPAARLSVIGAAVVGLLSFLTHAGWASGAHWFRLEAATDAQTLVVHGVNAGLVVLAFAGAFVLVFRNVRRLAAWVPLAAAWIGSSAVGCWGAWMLLTSALTGPVAQDQAPARLVAVFAVAAIAGAMLLVTGAHLFADWARARDRRGEIRGPGEAR